MYAQRAKQNFYMSTIIEQETHTNQSYQQTSDMDMFEQTGTTLNLLRTVLTKLK
jgi:hypothetical protein